VAQRLASGELAWDAALEDVHMNVEARLIEEIGEAGRRLHTARSRNDQVATDLRLYARAAAARLIEEIDELRRSLVRQARTHVDTLMPGYTHLQRAQPVRLAHHLLAYDAMLERDRGRIADAARRADLSPLGSGALAGTTLPIDRERVARALGFRGVTHNSLDAVGDRDFAIELVAAIALAQGHLSRLGEELVLWTTSEFGFARIGEAYCSGSSLMPQKMNPDLAELLRGKVGRTIGAWVTLMTVVKGLPLAYNKDLQETQEPLYDAVETLEASLAVARGMIDSLEFDVARLRAAIDQGHLVATELADYLVTRGVAFREAHDVAGHLVRLATERGVELAALPLDELRAVHPAFAADVAEWLDPQRAVDRRDLVGGPARARVIAEIDRASAALGIQRDP
jgi:argininosuccinate lyase